MKEGKQSNERKNETHNTKSLQIYTICNDSRFCFFFVFFFCYTKHIVGKVSHGHCVSMSMSTSSVLLFAFVVAAFLAIARCNIVSVCVRSRPPLYAETFSLAYSLCSGRGNGSGVCARAHSRIYINDTTATRRFADLFSLLLTDSLVE